MKMRFLIFIFSLSFIFSPVVAADTFDIDPTYSTIVHKTPHLMGFSVGIFEKFHGTLQFDEKNEKLLRVEVSIDVHSLNTRQARRDEDLRSERFFHTKQYPTATFQSTQISKETITGHLTLRGITKKVTLDYTYWGTGRDQYGKTKIALSANGKINRKDFGITYNQKTDDKKWLLGDEVQLIIEVQGILSEE